jgi:hypothetical protein
MGDTDVSCLYKTTASDTRGLAKEAKSGQEVFPASQKASKLQLLEGNSRLPLSFLLSTDDRSYEHKLSKQYKGHSFVLMRGGGQWKRRKEKLYT